jgi:D-alanyl-D-alanine carboxypeptidase
MSNSRVPVEKRSSRVAAGILAGLCLATVLWSSPADARHRHNHHFHHHRHHHHHVRVSYHIRHIRPGGETSKFAALVVDGYTGRELYGRDENSLRHPASITKVMTLYLLFEQLESGRLHMDSRIPISAHAAAQAPTKIGLRPGQSISVDDAIKAIVTQSANDIAVAIAEDIGGTESHFAEMMTRKAHELGMTRTHYANASGLPNDEQLTTAHDLAILGRDIQARFPRLYHYFSTRFFVYHGITYHNHNHLLGHVQGIDGIKTGYTRASGFNLMTSVKRDGHYIIAVVLGGASWASRDRIMDNLIEAHIDDKVGHHSAPLVAAAPADDDEEDRSEAPAQPEPRPLVRTAVTSPAETPATAAPMPAERPRPAFVSAAMKPMPLEAHESDGARDRGESHAFDGTTGRPVGATMTPSTLRWVVGPAPAKERETAAKRLAKAETLRGTPEATATFAAVAERPALARNGWMIQIGATDDASKASELLARAMAHGPESLSSAKPFTEKVRKGSETLYRARFAGLEASSAEAACKSLKRSGFACFATRN